METNSERSKRPFESEDANSDAPFKKAKLSVAESDELNGVPTDLSQPTCSKYVDAVSIPGSSSAESASAIEIPPPDEISLDSMPDDVLLILLTYLNSSDLVNLSLSNRRLHSLCKYRTLWYRVNAFCDGNAPSHVLLPLYFNDNTTYMRFQKPARNPMPDLEDTCFDDKFFETLNIKTPNLKTFILENHVLSFSTFKLEFLPQNLTELRFVNTNFLHFPQKLFDNAPQMLPNLEIVEVSFCQWFNTRMLFPLGKCPKLKELKTVGWRTMNEFIPYASIATISGFPRLETLDMRQTLITDREISCFHKARSLKHILLEKPDDMDASAEDSDSITDICTASLGMRNWRLPNGENQNGVFICPVPIEGSNCVEETLETLVVRKYPRITDITLKHAAKCLRSLKYLDVTGSSCTAEQIAVFKQNRPDVQLVHDVVVA